MKKKIQEEQDRLKIKHCKIQEELEELSYLLKLFILMEILYVCMYVLSKSEDLLSPDMP